MPARASATTVSAALMSFFMVVTSARFRPAASAVGESLAAGGHAKEPAGIGYLLVMAEIVYPPVLATARTLFRVLDYRFHLEGTEHVPRLGRGGAGQQPHQLSRLHLRRIGALPAKRLVRFMAKKDVFDHRISGPLMRGMHHIPVDREAGAGSYATALRMLKAGEVVGVFAEATISRSFTVKEIKNGAIRMAQAAKVPIIPVGAVGQPADLDQGQEEAAPAAPCAADHPGRRADASAPGRGRRPARGRPARPAVELVDRAQRTYPETPQGVWWQPAHLGGTAPTPEEAAAMDEEEARARAAKAKD